MHGEDREEYLALENWIVDAGDRVINKESVSGADSLTNWERLVKILWTADYMMRNAGDFANAMDMCPNFQEDAVNLTKSLDLPKTQKAFLLPQSQLQKQYFDLLPVICNELQESHSHIDTTRSL